MMDYSKIKVIIWDLDDTFWSGTLSEGEIYPIEKNMELVKLSTNRGVVNAICSKNDKEMALRKLGELNIRDLFVFPSIDWSPKGERIARLLNDMGLRAVNALFIDDNLQNINEVRHYSPDIMSDTPNCIDGLLEYFRELPNKDNGHIRLNQYKILEQKIQAKDEYSTNEDFLYSCNLRVDIHNDCLYHIDRIAELVKRANQLNYTKIRSTKEELKTLLSDDSLQCGYVTVSDKFGDYGIVGFFAINKENNRCVHFLFSCRTIGQGVEQWVYAELGYPVLDIVGEVITPLNKNQRPKWINQDIETVEKVESLNHSIRILFKGPCDYFVMTKYLSNSCNLDTEFSYIGSKNNYIESYNHPVAIMGAKLYTDEEKKLLIKECIFLDEDFFTTRLFDTKYNIVFISTILISHMGLYRRKGTNLIIPFGDYLAPLTDENNWDGLISGKLRNCQNTFTREYLEEFSKKYEFIGKFDNKKFNSFLKFLIDNLPSETYICFDLGSETPCLKDKNPINKDLHINNQKLNAVIRSCAKDNKRIVLLDINKFIKGQESLNDYINHFAINVYFKIANEVNGIISNILGSDIVGVKSGKQLMRVKLYFHFKKVVNMIVPAFVLRGIHVLAQKCLGLDRDFKFTELILKH